MAEQGADEAEVAAAWNRNAATWADSVRAGFDLYREHFTFPAFLKFLPPLDGLEVIDLGCGEGTNTRRFAGLGGRMTGIDLSEAMIARARAAEAQAPLGIRYEVCSYSRMDAVADDTNERVKVRKLNDLTDTILAAASALANATSPYGWSPVFTFTGPMADSDDSTSSSKSEEDPTGIIDDGNPN